MLGKDAALGLADPRALIAPTPAPIAEQTATTSVTNARTVAEPSEGLRPAMLPRQNV